MINFSMDDVLNKATNYFGDNQVVSGIVAKLKYYVAEFAMTDQQLRDARNKMNELRNAAIQTGSVKTSSGKILTLSDIDAMIAENESLQNERRILENKLMDFISTIQGTMESVSAAGETTSSGTVIGEEGFPFSPGMMGTFGSGLGIAPLAIAGIIATGGFLVYSISKFINAVRGNVEKTSGVIPFLFGDNIYIYLGLGLAAYLLFFKDKKLKS